MKIRAIRENEVNQDDMSFCGKVKYISNRVKYYYKQK